MEIVSQERVKQTLACYTMIHKQALERTKLERKKQTNKQHVVSSNNKQLRRTNQGTNGNY